MIEIIILILATYFITYLGVSSYALQKPRLWIRNKTLWLSVDDKKINPITNEIKNMGVKVHPLDCRGCFVVYASIFICILTNKYDLLSIISVAGGAYFLATQERR